MDVLRDRVQQLVLDTPEQMVLEMAERLLHAFGYRALTDSMPLRDVSYIVAAMVLSMKDHTLQQRAASVITITMDDGVRTTDG